MQVQNSIANQQIQEIIDLSNQLTSGEHSFYNSCDVIIKISSAVSNLINSGLNFTLSTDLCSRVEDALVGEMDYKWGFYKKIHNYFNNPKAEQLKEIESEINNPKAEQLQEIESEIKKIKENYLSRRLLDENFIKMIYLAKNAELTKLFGTYFPRPPCSFFYPDQPPDALVAWEKERDLLVSQFKNKHRQDEDDQLEKKVIYAQRLIRASIRQQSEIERISELYFEKSPAKRGLAIQAIQDANTPYRPKECSAALADRLLNASCQVKLFSSVSHIASAPHLASILDGILYGRKNLLNTNIDFRASAMQDYDIQQGDINVICFGPHEIDKNCFKDRSVKLEFNLHKLANECSPNPCIFFKQRDFGYLLEQKHVVKIKDDELVFNHTGMTINSKPNYIDIQIDYKGDDYAYLYATLPNYSFISYNLWNMHQILVLNFFRFLDNLTYKSGKPANNQIAEIYKKISELTDNELEAFLTDLGRKMSFTSEFNFYGAYQIDLSALLSLAAYQDKKEMYSIRLDKLIEELNQGVRHSLEKLKEYLPEIFRSSRFQDFLLSKILDPGFREDAKRFFKRDCSSLKEG